MAWTVRNMCMVVFVLMLLGIGDACQPDDEHIVKTTNGLLKGCKMSSRTGKDIYAFKGIRYAKPPIGPLRFSPPVKPDNWTDVKDAIVDGPECIQKNYLLSATPPVQGQEDCLYLNVFTGRVPLTNDIKQINRPVMVYIHGGGFFAGTGNTYLNGPDYLLDEDVLLVTMNYRLGIFGFLTTEDDEAPGNWALKDQNMALQWVQDNIAAFGGDPTRVTIFGQSAGSASVHFHTLSPISKGLFARAISQSGSALNLWATPQQPSVFAKLQGQFVNCTSNKTDELIKCLRNVNATTLVETGDKFKFWDIDPLIVYAPTVEKKTERNPRPFLDDTPINIIKNGKFNKVPIIMGVMANEGLIRAGPIMSKSELRNDLNNRWDQLGPELFGLSLSVPNEKVPELWKKMMSFYMNNQNYINISDSQNMQNFVNMYSDRSFIYHSYLSAIGHAKYVPTYFYNIEYVGKNTYGYLFAGTNETIDYKFGKCHCDDLIYLFKAPVLFPDPEGTDLDFSKVLIKMWTSFARDGYPFGRFWTPLNPESKIGEKFRYLNMAGPVMKQGNVTKQQINLSMRSNFLSDRMSFWKDLNLDEKR